MWRGGCHVTLNFYLDISFFPILTIGISFGRFIINCFPYRNLEEHCFYIAYVICHVTDINFPFGSIPTPLKNPPLHHIALDWIYLLFAAIATKEALHDLDAVWPFNDFTLVLVL